MGHLNSFFAPRGGNLNKPIFKSSNAPGRMLKLQIDWYIRGFSLINSEPQQLHTTLQSKIFPLKLSQAGVQLGEDAIVKNTMFHDMFQPLVLLF